jgi:hypothetical protein
MSRKKLRITKTELDNLVSNLRGEVGEIIATWTMLRRLMASANALRSKHENLEQQLHEDLRNEDLKFLDALKNKLSDEIVARLSELSESRIGQLTFHFAAVNSVPLRPTPETSAALSRNASSSKNEMRISATKSCLSGGPITSIGILSTASSLRA